MVKIIKPHKIISSLSNILKILVIFLFLSHSSNAQSQPSREYQVKAAFLFNFCQFVEWPPEVFLSSTSPFVIGILGTDPFGLFLDELIKGEKLNGRPIIVRRYANVKQVQNCHILFISNSEPQVIEQTLAVLGARSILTVSDSYNFANYGGVIQLSTENNKIKLTINVEAARTSRLDISSKLLRVSQINNSKKVIR